jgi:hypothetical protein
VPQKSPQDHPISPQDGPRSPQEAPRGAQGSPKKPQKDLKRLQKRLRNQKGTASGLNKAKQRPDGNLIKIHMALHLICHDVCWDYKPLNLQASEHLSLQTASAGAAKRKQFPIRA